jgi:DNA (cytosine-5)-methyltransferase 1
MAAEIRRNPNLQLSFADDELIVDNFAGGGGASTGIELALGRPIDIAINHDPEALAMHAANHPGTTHLCEDVWAVDIEKVVAGRKVGLAWFSPDCKHFSKAKGGKPVENKIRGLAWVAIKWAKKVKPRVIFLENVEEFQTWSPLVNGRPCPIRKGQTFKRWVNTLKRLGYQVEWHQMRACDYGAPTIRKRLFIVARCDGRAIVWPEETHAAKPCPGRELYRAASECIDWSIPCPSIFLANDEAKSLGVKRPLADATLRRIARGVMRYVVDAAEPFIVSLTHHGSDRLESIHEPFRTITGARRGEKALVRASFVSYAQQGGRNRSATDPLHTITASQKDQNAVVTAFLSHQYGASTGSSIADPTRTATVCNHQGLVTAFLSQYYGSHTKERGGDGRGQQVRLPLPTQPTENRHALVAAHIMKLRGANIGSPVTDPLHTLSAGGLHHAQVSAFLLKYYGTDQDPRLEESMHTLTTKDRLGLVTVTIGGEPYYVADIGMRMLTPAELFRAQGFPGDYIIEYGISQHQRGMFGFGDKVPLSKTAQVRLVGNSVSPPPAEALVRAQFSRIPMEAAA